MDTQRVDLLELKSKSPKDLLSFAEDLDIENANSMRKQDMLFAILKQFSEKNIEIQCEGVLEVLQDGFGFLRSPQSNYLPGPDDIYVSPNKIKKFWMKTGDTISGLIRAPKDNESYFAILKVNKINFESSENVRTKVHFDNLTPLYPNERLKMEIVGQDIKDKSSRVIDLLVPQQISAYPLLLLVFHLSGER
jgi:transcription termination factor Rho